MALLQVKLGVLKRSARQEREGHRVCQFNCWHALEEKCGAFHGEALRRRGGDQEKLEVEEDEE